MGMPAAGQGQGTSFGGSQSLSPNLTGFSGHLRGPLRPWPSPLSGEGAFHSVWGPICKAGLPTG